MSNGGGGGEFHDFLSKFFCLRVPKNSVGWESFIVSIVSGTEKFWLRGGREGLSFYVENFLSHITEIFRRGFLYCCNNFGYPKSSVKSGGRVGEFQDFLSKFFCFTVPKISAGWELFSVLLISGIEKVWLSGGGGSINNFHRKFFVSECRKILEGNPSALFFGNLPVAKKILSKRLGGGRVSRLSVENFLSHSAEKIRRGGNPLVFY